MKNQVKIPIAVLIGMTCLGGASFQSSPDPAGPGNPVLYSAYRGLEEFGVVDAWNMGYTGKGINVAVIDSGVDFGTPDLQGAQARVEAENSPYFGWPIVIDLRSLSDYQRNGFRRGVQYADTSSTDTGGYEITGTSRSGVYHIGDHPNNNLTVFNGGPVKVLVADEKAPGVYDTVYVDLNNNRDFRDDKPCRRGDEISHWDRDQDGLSDESGGLIYFIADGRTPLPFGRMLYGDQAKVPGNGELTAFHYDAFSPGHGTMCAGTIAAQGRNVRGIAPGARLVAVNMMGGGDMLLCLLSTLGYDGLPDTGDEANIISRSAALNFPQSGADEVSAFLDYLGDKVSPTTSYVYGNGNSGSGYGTCLAPMGDHVVKAGAIVDLWWKDSPHRGDIVCFSSRGPNLLGQVSSSVLGTGFHAPRVRNLSYTHCGRSAWDRYGGGTSNATPHASAVMALIYQAYKAAHGKLPTSVTARDILMSSADDIGEEVFAQGAGILNARRAVELASGRNAVLVQPAQFTPPPVEAGSILEFKFALANYSGRSVSARPLKLFKKDLKSFHIPASDDMYLVPIEKTSLTGDLARICTYSALDPGRTTSEEAVGYSVYLHNWKDRNGDGEYGPGARITPQEAQDQELQLLAIDEWDSTITAEVRVHDPQHRVDDGLLLELKKKPEMKSRDVTIVVETYEWRDWTDLRAESSQNEIKCRLRTPEETGVYQGKILLETGGAEKAQCIPVSFATYRRGEIKAAGTTEIYENTRLYGRFEEGSQNAGWRDARFYPLYHEGTGLISIGVSWEDPGTELDIAIFGQGSVDTSALWDYSTKPPIELPVLPVLKDNGHSPRRQNSLHPSLPGTQKTIAGIVQDGLNVLVVAMANSGGRGYGENVQVRIEPLSSMAPRTVQLSAKAGETLNWGEGDADRIVGFGEEKKVSGEYTFEARKDDVVVFRPTSRNYMTGLLFDSDRNGKPDEGRDKIIFNVAVPQTLEVNSGDAIRLPYDGTYFTTFFMGSFYHLQDRHDRAGGAFTLRIPDKAGDYLGIAEKDGILLPVSLDLKVEPREPARIVAAEAAKSPEAKISGAAVNERREEPAAKEPGQAVPAQVKSVTGRSERYRLTITWRPPEDGDVDHYCVYKWEDVRAVCRWVKKGEVKNPEYTLEAGPWTTHTFRISVVDRAGNEGKPSDPYGIVATRH